ncbi:thioredoxin family protein [Sphingobacterium sp. UT-1RO-CII-1]|uniref:thioredoxin family protein n=1 Tax=Sphingobacterium sp. UT-1RO-CII-1 TaxID=2995225 RepID=UPI00227A2DC8|nr:thioredoxin family protein [Sphingobacterium sp. UT-1RO-CII-1]MCY4778342.1 thioredoxin family protein [Sphingobacterium sp. UT-1RO-CII-1]
MYKYIILGISLFISIHSNAQKTESVNWLTFEQLSDSLKVKPKNVLLFFHTDWCGYCRKMMNEGFTDPEIVKTINEKYYAVSFDAESVDTVYFDGQMLTNKISRKKTGQYHMITELLANKNGQFVFPTTLLLDDNFIVQKRFFQYMDKKKLLKAL